MFGLYRISMYSGFSLDRISVYSGFSLYRISVYSGFSLYRILVYSGFSLDRISVYSGFSLDRFHCIYLLCFYYFTGPISVVRHPTPSPCQHSAFVSCFVLHSPLLYLALGMLKNRFIVGFFSTESVFGYDCV